MPPYLYIFTVYIRQRMGTRGPPAKRGPLEPEFLILYADIVALILKNFRISTYCINELKYPDQRGWFQKPLTYIFGQVVNSFTINFCVIINQLLDFKILISSSNGDNLPLAAFLTILSNSNSPKLSRSIDLDALLIPSSLTSLIKRKFSSFLFLKL